MYRDYFKKKFYAVKNKAAEILEAVSGIPPLELLKSAGKPLVDYKIYGNSVQDGVPTVDEPVVIMNVGDLIDDENDEHFGKYKIPVKVNERTTNIYLDEPLRKIGNYADCIDFKNKTVIRKIRSEVYTGNEGFNNFSDNLFTTSAPVARGLNSADNTMMCNLCTPSRSQNIGWRNNNVNQFQINKSWIGADTVAELKEVLAEMYENGNPLTMHYILLDPIVEDIDLPEIQTYKGTDVFTVGTEVLPSGCEIEYYGR